MSDVQQAIDAQRACGQLICQRIAEAIDKLGFAVQTQIEVPVFDAAQFRLVTDPYSQTKDLVGVWFSSSQQRIGQIQFRGDGSFYAEYDVVQPHPGKPKFFVEAIHAWGRPEAIKTEAKLLALPTE